MWQLMPPGNRTVSELAEETGISAITLYAWRKQARAAGAVVPGDGKSPEGWSSQEKFRVVLESAALSESELAEYCRRKGLYVEQVREWRVACEQANATAQGRRRYKAALAEAAALLVLRKKAQAIWGEDEDD